MVLGFMLNEPGKLRWGKAGVMIYGFAVQTIAGGQLAHKCVQQGNSFR